MLWPLTINEEILRHEILSAIYLKSNVHKGLIQVYILCAIYRV